MFCTKCGAPLTGGKFCTVCGAPVNAAVEEPAPVLNDNCAMCGAPLEGRTFCVMCGAKKGTTPDSPSVPAPVVAAEPVAEEVPGVEAPVSDDNCAVCGSPLEGRAFCVMCGAKRDAVTEAPVVAEPVAEEVTAVEAPVSDDNCAVCGAPLEGRAFCVMCGAKRDAVTETPVVAEPVAEEVPVVEVPVSDDNCAVCGAPLEGRAFCVMCGAKKAAEPAPLPADNCANCGSPLNGKAFCVVCGTSKNGSAPVQQPVQNTYIPPVTKLPDTQKEVSPLKKAFGSAKFLITAIFVTLGIFINIIASAGGIDIPGMPAASGAASTASAISSNILPILIAVGLWITYISAKGSGKLTSGGITICSVVMIINYIASWIGFAITALLGLVFFVPGLMMLVSGRREVFNGFITATYGSDSVAGALALGLCLLVAAGVLLLFVLLFYRRLCKFAKSASKSVKTETVEYKYERPVKRWLSFIGILSIISAVILLIVGLAIPVDFITKMAVGTLCYALATIFGGSWVKSNCYTK